MEQKYLYTACAISVVLGGCASSELGESDDGDSQIEDAISAPADFEETIDSEEFLRVIEQVADLYRPAASAEHGATMIVRPAFDDTQSVFASRLEGIRQWVMEPRARSLNARLTRDTARFITCHEVGHFFAGFPFFDSSPAVPNIDDTGTFLAAESSADYFATHDCLRRVWAYDPNNAAFARIVTRETGSQTARMKCDAAWSRTWERNICYRSVAVAHRYVAYLGNSGFNANIDTPDPAIVLITVTGHLNRPQCSFDTMVAGALCDAPVDLSVIPGLVPSARTGLFGDHSEAAEAHAEPYACHGDSPGARPLCWFKPHMPEFADCGDVTELGTCDGNDVLICNRNAGVLRSSCPEGQTCVLVEDLFPECHDI